MSETNSQEPERLHDRIEQTARRMLEFVRQLAPFAPDQTFLSEDPVRDGFQRLFIIPKGDFPSELAESYGIASVVLDVFDDPPDAKVQKPTATRSCTLTIVRPPEEHGDTSLEEIIQLSASEYIDDDASEQWYIGPELTVSHIRYDQNEEKIPEEENRARPTPLTQEGRNQLIEEIKFKNSFDDPALENALPVVQGVLDISSRLNSWEQIDPRSDIK